LVFKSKINHIKDIKMPKESNFHVTPESGRYAMTLSKEQLKWVKKMSIDFEIPIKKLLPLAIDLMIIKYKSLSLDEIENEGIKTLTGN
jgi:hypothetical protein